MPNYPWVGPSGVLQFSALFFSPCALKWKNSTLYRSSRHREAPDVGIAASRGNQALHLRGTMHSIELSFAARALVIGATNTTDAGRTVPWVAKCRIVPSVSRNGVILVVVAILGMVIGISLELLARQQVERYKEVERRVREREAADGIFFATGRG